MKSARVQLEALSRDVRSPAGDEHLNNRRRIVELSLGAAACMGLIALHQIGVVRRMPEPPLPKMNGSKVVTSGDAYALLQVGDAFLGFVSYGVTMLLAAMGGSRRAEHQPWLPIALAAKAAFDAAQGGRLGVEQWTKHHALCFWCLVATTASLAALPLAIPEAREALRSLGGKRFEDSDVARLHAARPL